MVITVSAVVVAVGGFEGCGEVFVGVLVLVGLVFFPWF